MGDLQVAEPGRATRRSSGSSSRRRPTGGTTARRPAASTLAPLKEGERKDFEKAIRSFARLKDGFDGYGGVASKKKAIENTVAFLRLLRMSRNAARPLAAPESDGSVALLWDLRDAPFHLHVSFQPDGTIGWYGDAPGLDAYETPEDIAFLAKTEAELPENLRRFLRAVPPAA